MTRRPEPADFTVELRADGAQTETVVVVSGEFDLTKVDEFEQAVQKLPDSDDVVIDLAGTTLIDSAAIGAMLRLRRDRKAVGRTVEVSARRPFQRRLFEVTGLEHLLTEADRPPDDPSS